MSANSRMTVAIHVLSFLAMAEKYRPDPVVTSDEIADSVGTNPVVIRRMLGRLKARDIVESHRGAKAGWTMRHKPAAISLLDVYDAVEHEPLFAMHASSPDPRCYVARGVLQALETIYGALEDGLHKTLSRTTLEDVIVNIRR